MSLAGSHRRAREHGAESFTRSKLSPKRGCVGAKGKGAVGAGWAGWSDAVGRKTRIYNSSSWAWGGDEHIFRLPPLRASRQIAQQAVVFGFSRETNKLSLQQHFIAHFLQHCKGIRSGKKPQIIKK